MNSLDSPWPAASGLATTSITTLAKAKNITPSFELWPLNGFGSSSGAGKTGRLTTTTNTWKSSRKGDQFLPPSTWNKKMKTVDGSAQRTVCAAPAAAARRGHAFWGSFGDFGHPHLLRLVLRTQPRSGGGSKMRPFHPGSRHFHLRLKRFEIPCFRPHALDRP